MATCLMSNFEEFAEKLSALFTEALDEKYGKRALVVTKFLIASRTAMGDVSRGLMDCWMKDGDVVMEEGWVAKGLDFSNRRINQVLDNEHTPDLMTPLQAAGHLNLSTGTLANWRYEGRGPDYVRVSDRKIMYRKIDLNEWLGKRSVKPGAS